jgi:hypothetical protein
MKKRDKKRTKKDFTIIIFAAVFGAFCLGIADLIINGDASTVMKMGDIMHKHLGMPSSGGIALLLLMLLGAGLCIVRQPKTRIDSFTIGLSVFAVLTLSPYQESNPPKKATLGPDPQISIALKFAANVNKIPEYVAVKLTDKKTDKNISKRYIPSTQGVSFDLNPGDYILKFEAQEIRTTSTMLTVGTVNASYTVLLEGSDVPVNLQKLVLPRDVQLIEQ